MEKLTHEITHIVETYTLNTLKKALKVKLDEARVAASNFNESSDLAPWLQTSKERIFYDQLCFFLDRTKNIKASIFDCNNLLKKNRNEILDLKRNQENELKYLIGIEKKLKGSINTIVNCLTDGHLMSNLSNEAIYKINTILNNNEVPTDIETHEAINNLDYYPKSLRMYSTGIFVQEGKYETFSLAKNELLETIKIIQSKGYESKKNNYKKISDKLEEKRKKPSEIAETIFHWRNELILCLRAEYKKEDITHTPSLLTREHY